MNLGSWVAWFGEYKTLLAVAGILATLIVMGFGNVGSRLGAVDARLVGIDARFDALNARFDAMQAENARRFDAMQAEDTRRFDAVVASQVAMAEALRAEHSESRRQLGAGLDQVLETLRDFESRISRLEGRADSP